MKWLRRGRWWQLALALALLVALGAYYAYLARALPPVPRATVLPGYDSSVCLFSPDSQLLVTCDTIPDADVCWIDLWDVATGEHRCSLAEWDTDRTINFSPDGRLLSVGTPQTRLALWDVVTQQRSPRRRAEYRPQLAFFRSFSPRPFSCDWFISPDGRFVVTSFSGLEDQIVFWEVAAQKERARIEGRLEQLQFAPDGKRFTICQCGRGNRHRIQRWEIADDGEPRFALEQHVGADAVAVSSDLQTFVTARRRPNGAAELFPCSGQRFPVATAFPEAIPELSAGCVIQFWDLATGEEKAAPVHARATLSINSLEFSRSGRFLIANRNTTYPSEWVIWDTSGWFNEVPNFSEQRELSPREHWVLTNSSDGAELWDIDSRAKYLDVNRRNDYSTLIERGPNHWSYSSKARFSADDRWVIASGLSASRPVNPVEAIRSGQWNRINGTESYQVCRLWDVEAREEVATFRDCWGAVLSPDGRTLAVQDSQDRLRLYDVPPPRPWGVPLALTIVTWGLALLLCWAVKRRVRRWRASLATAPAGASPQ
jgi:WD40 repeat protein